MRTLLPLFLSFAGCGAPEDAAELSLGLATPRLLASEPSLPQEVLQDDTHIYYFSSDTLSRVAKTGGAVQRTTLPVSLQAIALGGDSVIGLDYQGQLWKAAKSGGTPQVIATGLVDARGPIAADASAAYVLGYVQEGDRWTQRIARVAGGVATTVAQSTYVTDLAIDDSSLFFSDEAEPNPAIGCGRNAGSVFRAPKLGGPRVTLVTGQTCLFDVILDSSRVYFAGWNIGTTGDTQIASVPKSGGLLRAHGKDGSSLAVDAGYVYWLSSKKEAVR